ncbi:MAG: hypothetical protein U1F14_05905 [Steroidobacteraceae bacterium]
MNIDSREALTTSLLAEVVYSNLPANAIGTTDSARQGLVAALLQSDTVDVAMGEEIGRRYVLLSVRESGWSGFCAAVFRDRGTRQLYLAIRGADAASPLDLLDDAALVAGATGGRLSQSESLQRYIAEIRADQAAGRLPPGSLTLTGHSLGGYLVQHAVFECAGLVTAAYTFNSAGIGGLLGLAGGTRYVLSSDTQFVRNFIAEPGLGVVSSRMSGPRPGREYTTFIEDQSGDAAPGSPPVTVRGNRSIAPLADALGVYRVMDLLAHGGQTFEQLTALLAATTRYSLDTLESTLSGIGQFFGVATDSRYTDARARMHDLTFRLIEVLEGPAGAGTGLENLLGLAPDALARAAAEDTPQGLAVRYALMHGQPFAVTGIDYQTTVNADGRYDRERFSSAYLQARAEYAQLLFFADDTDTPRPPADAPVSAATHHDVEIATVLAATDGSLGGRTVFGRDQDGPGAGADACVVNAAEFRLGSRPITQVADGSGACVDDAGNRYVPATRGLRVLLDCGVAIDIDDFSPGDFGLTPGAALEASPPPDVAHHAAQPLNRSPSGPATGQYGVLGWPCHGVVYAAAAREMVDALAPVVTAPGSQTQYVSVAAGFGDSRLAVDCGFNYVIDERTTGTAVLVGTCGLGSEVADDLLRGGSGDDRLVTQGGSDQSLGEDVLIDLHETRDLMLLRQPGTPTRYDFDSAEWVDVPGHASETGCPGRPATTVSSPTMATRSPSVMAKVSIPSSRSATSRAPPTREISCWR